MGGGGKEIKVNGICHVFNGALDLIIIKYV